MRQIPVISCLILLALSACTSQDDLLRRRAVRLAYGTLILDGHIDVPHRLREKMEDISRETAGGEFDYPRARAGGLDAPFMSIYTSASLDSQGRSHGVADSLISMMDSIAAAHPDMFAVATSPDQVEENFKRGVLSFCYGMENGSPLEKDLANVGYFHKRGVRYVTLTHSLDNAICDSSYDSTRTWHGLSPFGRDVVVELNRVGIMIDVSHISDDAFWQVMEITKAPVIASHSSCRSFVPGKERNIDDAMIRRLAENGGVVQVNFGSTFISDRADKWQATYGAARDAFLSEHGHTRGGGEEQKFSSDYRRGDPFPFADVTDVANHIDHIVSLVGTDHVGFGSDFDGVGETLPVGLKSVADYPNLIHELLKRDYTEADIRKIAGGNVLRVWREAERVARESR